MILAAALLVLAGLALFVGGILTGSIVLYWSCVAACVVAGLFLVVARIRMARAPVEPPVPAPSGPAGTTGPTTQELPAAGATAQAGPAAASPSLPPGPAVRPVGAPTGETAAVKPPVPPAVQQAAPDVRETPSAPARETPSAPAREAPPTPAWEAPPPAPAWQARATPAWQARATPAWEARATPAWEAPPAVPAGQPPQGEAAAAPPAAPPAAAHSPHGASGAAARGEPPVEDVEVTDLLLVLDLRDEVLVVDEHPRYHLTGCRGLRGRDTFPLPVDEARTDGFTPCAWCKPDRTLAERERGRRTGRQT